MAQDNKEHSVKIAGEIIKPGQVKQIEIPVARLPTQTLICLARNGDQWVGKRC